MKPFPHRMICRRILAYGAIAVSLAVSPAAVAMESGGEAPVVADPTVRTAPPRAKPREPARAARQKPAAEPVRQRPRAEPSRRAAAPTVVRSARPAAPARQAARETAPSGAPAAGETRMLADEVVVRFRLSARQSAMDALVRRLGLRHLEARTFAAAGITVHRYALARGQAVAATIAALEADPAVVYAQPNYLYALLQGAAAAAPGAQYAIDALAIRGAHALTSGRGVTVAVIDSGIDRAHPEFAGGAIEARDVAGDAATPPHAHGTSIAGIIAARGTLMGIAPEVSLVGIRAFVDDGAAAGPYGTSWRIAAGFDAALKAGARVVNMSFAGPRDPLVEQGVGGLARRGVAMVAAAGNEGASAPPQYPAAYDGVIAVTAVDSAHAAFAAANIGDYIAFAAPGVDIVSPAPGNAYQITSGTSLAAAHVSGVAALLLARDPRLKPQDIDRLLSAAATDLGEPGRDATYGNGLPDAAKALAAAKASD
jgi:subtilisin family serine protease